MASKPLKFKRIYGHFERKLRNKLQASLMERNVTVNLTRILVFVIPRISRIVNSKGDDQTA